MRPISDAFAQLGPHEKQIRSFFPGTFERDAAEPPIFSKPLYILGFTNRSGSNMLADYLRQTGQLRGFGEGLNWDEIRRNLETCATASFPDYIARLASTRNEPGTWGIKATWDQILMLQRANIFSMFSGVQIIHSVRCDVIGQAISHWIAHQTKKWTSLHHENGVTPKFSQEDIEHITMDIVRSNAYIDLIARTSRIPRHVVVYEQLHSNPADEMRRLAKALVIDLGAWQPRAPRISMQRSVVNQDFRAKCLVSWQEAILNRSESPRVCWRPST